MRQIWLEFFSQMISNLVYNEYFIIDFNYFNESFGALSNCTFWLWSFDNKCLLLFDILCNCFWAVWSAMAYNETDKPSETIKIYFGDVQICKIYKCAHILIVLIDNCTTRHFYSNKAKINAVYKNNIIKYCSRSTILFCCWVPILTGLIAILSCKWC